MKYKITISDIKWQNDEPEPECITITNGSDMFVTKNDDETVIDIKAVYDYLENSFGCSVEGFKANIKEVND